MGRSSTQTMLFVTPHRVTSFVLRHACTFIGCPGDKLSSSASSTLASRWAGAVNRQAVHMLLVFNNISSSHRAQPVPVCLKFVVSKISVLY